MIPHIKECIDRSGELISGHMWLWVCHPRDFLHCINKQKSSPLANATMATTTTTRHLCNGYCQRKYSETRDQILDEAVCVSLCTIALRKGIN